MDYDGKSETFNDLVRYIYIKPESAINAKIYPNPTVGNELFLEVFNPERGQVYRLELMDSNGRMMSKPEISLDHEQNYIRYNLLNNGSLSKGVYFLALKGTNTAATFKIVVQ